MIREHSRSHPSGGGGSRCECARYELGHLVATRGVDEGLRGTWLTTPPGPPACSRTCAMARAVSGVSDAGLHTTVQPAARAGPILRVSMAAGKFHGVTSAATPMGWRRTRILCAPDGATVISPVLRTASSAYQRKNSAA